MWNKCCLFQLGRDFDTEFMLCLLVGQIFWCWKYAVCFSWAEILVLNACCSSWAEILMLNACCLFQLGKTLDALVTSFRPSAQMVSIAGEAVFYSSQITAWKLLVMLSLCVSVCLFRSVCVSVSLGACLCLCYCFCPCFSLSLFLLAQLYFDSRTYH